MVIDVFIQGIARRDFREFLGRQKPQTVAILLKIVNEWADGEDLARRGRILHLVVTTKAEAVVAEIRIEMIADAYAPSVHTKMIDPSSWQQDSQHPV